MTKTAKLIWIDENTAKPSSATQANAMPVSVYSAGNQDTYTVFYLLSNGNQIPNSWANSQLHLVNVEIGMAVGNKSDLSDIWKIKINNKEYWALMP
jgi:hypothetical protein